MTARRDSAPAVTPPVTDPVLDYDCDILILGIGNLLWADEGFGIRALETLHQGWRFRPGVRLLDGGTQGLYLLPYVEGCRRLLVLDAVDYGLEPGTLKIVRDGDVPAFMGAKKMSLHQTGFQEVLAVAGLRGWRPEAVCLVGMQPEMLEDYGGSLTDTVKAALPAALDAALANLADWGARPERRTEPPGPDERLTFDSLDIAPYEAERPSAEAAYRMGDARFLNEGGA
ncbi:MAG: HyaD/HybD family hydrogenase maturation endopeptidase [Thiobacillus sp.]|nr:HyaD/HybD family hydrogenase maturation endopeptidase [Thiobacillus sp.]